MNATKWPSLTEFAKFLGREGICRVEEEDKGLMVAWIDNSPEALRRQDAIRKKERQDRGDEEREQAAIRKQIRRAKQDAEERGDTEADDKERELKRAEGEKIKLSFGTKAMASNESPVTEKPVSEVSTPVDEGVQLNEASNDSKETAGAEPTHGKVSLKMGFSSKPKNVFAAAKKNALGGKKATKIEEPKKMSEAERIMKEEIERKRSRDSSGLGGPAHKKPRF